MHDDFFDDLPEDMFNSRKNKNFMPKSSSEQKRDNIEAAIKIRAKFRQIKHQLGGFKDIEGLDRFDEEDQKPEDVKKFIDKF